MQRRLSAESETQDAQHSVMSTRMTSWRNGPVDIFLRVVSRKPAKHGLAAHSAAVELLPVPARSAEPPHDMPRSGHRVGLHTSLGSHLDNRSAVVCSASMTSFCASGALSLRT